MATQQVRTPTAPVATHSAFIGLLDASRKKAQGLNIFPARRLEISAVLVKISKRLARFLPLLWQKHIPILRFPKHQEQPKTQGLKARSRKDEAPERLEKIKKHAFFCCIQDLTYFCRTKYPHK
ncbi:MAG: hypothetical protein IJZ92_03500 [Bacteroidaceae bacterium]|nr:hypothetical protein [Bacteroidaceae bacterium]